MNGSLWVFWDVVVAFKLLVSDRLKEVMFQSFGNVDPSIRVDFEHPF